MTTYFTRTLCHTLSHSLFREGPVNYDEEGIVTAEEEEDKDSFPLIRAQPLIAAPTALEITCAWALMVVGVIAVPIFVYSTAKGNSDTTPAPPTLSPLTHAPINATDLW